MKTVWNVLLGLTAAVCALALLFQGFAFTALSPFLALCLKIVGTLCCQWFFLRISRNKLVQAVPLMVSGILAVWGFFLFLTSPSWIHATFSDFLADYASYAIVCGIVIFLSWLLPRLFQRIRQNIQSKIRRKKEATPPPRGYAKQKSKGVKR